MKAIVIARPGGPEVLEVREVAAPAPAAWDVRVRVRASALNRADVLQARGQYPAPHGAPSDIPGLEYSGEVESVGEFVTRFRPGDRVMGLTGGGAFAEELVVHEREAIRIPDGLSFEEAAAIPEAFITAWDALVPQGQLRSGEAVLIHAVASGVGTAALQLVRALGGKPVGTARSQDKLDRLRAEFGLEASIHVAEPKYAAEVRQLTAGRGADLALELVGGRYLPETLDSLAPRGRAVLVGLMAGASAEIDLRRVLSRRLSLRGTVLRSRPIEEKLEAAQAAERHLVPLFVEGKVKPVIDQVLSFGDVARAFERMAANVSFGKIVLRW